MMTCLSSPRPPDPPLQCLSLLALVGATMAAPQLLSAPSHVVLGGGHHVSHHAVAHPVVHHAVAHHGLAHHAIAHPIAHHAPLVHAVAHAAPAYHAAPLVHAAPAYHAAEVYPDEISPYTYNYAVADDYSQSNFNAAESNDGTGVVQGSYQVNLPDGRIQTVTYHANDLEGYVAEVAYSGEAVYPVAVAAPAYHA